MEFKMNKMAEVSNISDQSPEMLDLLKHKNISLGTKLEIRKRFSVDNSLEIRIKNQSPVTISEHVAKNVFVKNVE